MCVYSGILGWIPANGVKVTIPHKNKTGTLKGFHKDEPGKPGVFPDVFLEISGAGDYQHWFNSKSKAIVAKYYAEDLRVFHYNFEGSTLD